MTTDSFNPHPARRPGAAAGGAPAARRPRVSTPTRPEGRVLPWIGRSLVRWKAFQPPPGPKAGCCQHDRQRRVAALEVSTPTRPEGRVLPGNLSRRQSPPTVSTPTRPEGRVLLARGRWQVIFDEFQPPPGPKAGCCPADLRVVGAQLVGVSTPTRPEGRVLPANASSRTTPTSRTFQPPPGPKAGCCARRFGHGTSGELVSTPTRPEGRVLRADRDDAAAVHGVSTPTRPEGRVLLLVGQQGLHEGQVSTPTRPEGRVLQLLGHGRDSK